MKNILQQQFNNNLNNFKRAIKSLNQARGLNGQQIVSTSGLYFQSFEDLVILSRAKMINRQQYNHLFDKLDGLIKEAKIIINNKLKG